MDELNHKERSANNVSDVDVIPEAEANPQKTADDLELDSFDVNAIFNDDDEPENKTENAKQALSHPAGAEVKDTTPPKAATKAAQDLFDVDAILNADDEYEEKDTLVRLPRKRKVKLEQQNPFREGQISPELADLVDQMQDMVTELLLEDGTEPAKLQKFTSVFLQAVMNHAAEILDKETPAQEMSTIFHTACTCMNKQEKQAFTEKITLYSPLGASVLNMLTDGREIDASSENVDKWMEKVDEKQSIYAVRNDRAEILKASDLSTGLSELQKQLSDTDPFWMMTNSDQFRKVKTTLSEALKAVAAYETLSRQMKANKKQTPELQEQRQKLQEEMLQKLDDLAEASETYRKKKANQSKHNNRDRSREAIAGKISALAGCFVVNTRVKTAAAMSLTAKDQKDVSNLSGAFVDAAIALDKYPNQPCKKEMLALAYSNATAKFGDPLANAIAAKLDHSAPQVQENDAKGLSASNQFKERIRNQFHFYLTQSQKIVKDFEAGQKAKPELLQYLKQKPKALNGKGI